MHNIRKPLNLGFIGGSINSAVGYTHFSSSMMDNKWALVSGCFSRQQAVNNSTGDAYGVSAEHIYSCWQEMIEKEKDRLDAIAILTPTPAHFQIVIACLNAQIPVICEKALVTNYQEAKQILSVLEKRKGFLAVTYNYSGYPMVRELRNLIQKGILGKLLHFQIEMPQEGFVRVDSRGRRPIPQSWRLSDGEIPTLHLDLAVHIHHIIYYLTGQKPVEVVSDQASDGWFNSIVDNVSCLCRYTDNIQGQIWFSKSALGHRNGLRVKIYGSEAAAEWVQIFPEELTLSFVNGQRQILDRASAVDVANQQRYTRFKAGHPAGFLEAFANLYYDIAECLQEYKSSGSWLSDEVFSATLAAEGLQFLEAMVHSCQSKKWEVVEKNK